MLPLRGDPRAAKFTDTVSRRAAAKGRREGRVGNYCLMGTEGQFGKMKSLGDGGWGMGMVS